MQYFVPALLINILIAQTASATHLKPLTVCWEANLKPPYLQMNQHNQLSGITFDWINHIFKEQNIPLKHVTKPWKRCLQDAQRGNVDLVPNASFKLSRSLYALYSKPIYTTRLKFFYLKEKFNDPFKLQSLNDFKQFKIGGVGGYNYAFYKDKLSIDTGANSRSALIKKLQRNRIDFAIMQEQVLYSLLKDSPSEIATLGQVNAPLKPFKNYHILISKKNHQAPKILHILNSGFSSLRVSANYQRILDKYLPRKLSYNISKNTSDNVL